MKLYELEIKEGSSLKRLMLGNEAVARGAYEADVKVVSSYPGTPSTEITEYVSKYEDIYSEWAPNEKVAVEVAVGASIAGARAMSAMKHVGLNVAADPLFTSSYTGVNGGLVIVVADDAGMHSSQNEQDSRHYAKAAKLPMLEPSDSQEAKDYAKIAFELSEKFDTPVLLRMTTRVSHSQSLVEINEKSDVGLKEYVKNFKKYVMIPGTARSRHIIVEKRMEDMKTFADGFEANRIEWGDARKGFITSGTSYQYIKEIFPEASVLKLGMVYPLPEKLIKEFADKVENLYVIEELDPFIEQYVKSLGITDFQGKEILPLTGEYSVELLEEKLLGKKQPEMNEQEINIPERPPVLCPGCPHRGLYYVLNKLKLVVTGDIGCYTLGALPPLKTIDAVVCMGAGIGMAHGMAKARGEGFAAKTVAVIGDSTFMHSGITGMINIAYNKGISTIIVLDNSITGMTGHQNNPSNGLTIKNEQTVQADIVKLAEAAGIKRITIVDPADIKEVERVVKQEISAKEPSVIITRRPCVLLKYVKTSEPYSVDSEMCIECKLCMRLGCPAIVEIEDGVKINYSICNGCGLCADVCPKGAIVKEGTENE